MHSYSIASRIPPCLGLALSRLGGLVAVRISRSHRFGLSGWIGLFRIDCPKIDFLFLHVFCFSDFSFVFEVGRQAGIAIRTSPFINLTLDSCRAQKVT